MTNAEKYIIGHLLSEEPKTHLIFARLKEEFFSSLDGRAMFRAIKDTLRTHGSITSGELLKMSRAICDSITAQDITSCMLAYDSDYFLESHVREISKFGIITCAERRLREIAEEEIDPKALHTKFSAYFDALYADAGVAVVSESAFKEAKEDFLQRRATRRFFGVPFGIPKLDRITSGMMPGNLVVVGALTSIGKTALAINFCVEQVTRYGIVPLFVSLEMNRVEIAQRMASIHTGITASAIGTGALTDKEAKEVEDSYEAFSGLKFFCMDQNISGVYELCRKIRNFVAKNKVDIIYVDYLQLLGNEKSKGNSRQTDVADVSRNLKALAMDLKIPVCAMAQLNQESESRGDGRPRVSDLRESKAISHDADKILLLWRPLPHEIDETNRNCAKVYMDKNRGGALADVDLYFIPETMTFKERNR